MTTSRRTHPPLGVPDLRTGDRMTQAEFHRIYERTPPEFHAELIGGIVYVAGPVNAEHGKNHAWLEAVCAAYTLDTPGVDAYGRATLLLGEESEPEPDVTVRILPEYGGQSDNTRDEYIKGAPELVAEVAYSSRAIDLHVKRHDYLRYGVCEYLVLSLREWRFRWFDLRADRELAADGDGIIRIRCFPGLWLDVEAFLNKDPTTMAVLKQGLASSEHAAFVRMLAEVKVAGEKRKKSARGKRQ